MDYDEPLSPTAFTNTIEGVWDDVRQLIAMHGDGPFTKGRYDGYADDSPEVAGCKFVIYDGSEAVEGQAERLTYGILAGVMNVLDQVMVRKERF